MHRRTFLKNVAASFAAAVTAGCGDTGLQHIKLDPIDPKAAEKFGFEFLPVTSQFPEREAELRVYDNEMGRKITRIYPNDPQGKDARGDVSFVYDGQGPNEPNTSTTMFTIPKELRGVPLRIMIAGKRQHEVVVDDNGTLGDRLSVTSETPVRIDHRNGMSSKLLPGEQWPVPKQTISR